MVYIIDPGTFAAAKIQDIRRIFKRTSGINIPLRFLGFNYGDEAFYDSAFTSIGSPFIVDQYIPEVISVARMFYRLSTSSPRGVDNLGTFVTAL